MIIDEAGIGTEKNQENYRLAILKNDVDKISKLKVQKNKRKEKMKKWLEDNGYF